MIDKIDISKGIKSPCSYLKQWCVGAGSALRVTLTADIQNKIDAITVKITNADNEHSEWNATKNSDGTFTVEIPSSNFEHFGFIKQGVQIWSTLVEDTEPFCLAFADLDIAKINPTAIPGRGTWVELKLAMDALEVRVGEIDERVEVCEADITALEGRVETVEGDIDTINENIEGINEDIAEINEDIAEIREEMLTETDVKKVYNDSNDEYINSDGEHYRIASEYGEWNFRATPSDLLEKGELEMVETATLDGYDYELRLNHDGQTYDVLATSQRDSQLSQFGYPVFYEQKEYIVDGRRTAPGEWYKDYQFVKSTERPDIPTKLSEFENDVPFATKSYVDNLNEERQQEEAEMAQKQQQFASETEKGLAGKRGMGDLDFAYPIDPQDPYKGIVDFKIAFDGGIEVILNERTSDGYERKWSSADAEYANVFVTNQTDGESDYVIHAYDSEDITMSKSQVDMGQPFNYTKDGVQKTGFIWAEYKITRLTVLEDIPTKLSDLDNDEGFVTEAEVSELTENKRDKDDRTIMFAQLANTEGAWKYIKTFSVSKNGGTPQVLPRAIPNYNYHLPEPYQIGYFNIYANGSTKTLTLMEHDGSAFQDVGTIQHPNYMATPFTLTVGNDTYTIAPTVDGSGSDKFALEGDVPTKTSQLQNDSGFLGQSNEITANININDTSSSEIPVGLKVSKGTYSNTFTGNGIESKQGNRTFEYVLPGDFMPNTTQQITTREWVNSRGYATTSYVDEHASKTTIRTWINAD